MGDSANMEDKIRHTAHQKSISAVLGSNHHIGKLDAEQISNIDNLVRFFIMKPLPGGKKGSHNGAGFN